jgi:transposase
MPKTVAQRVSDEFWSRVEPLIPTKEPDPNRPRQRKPGGGRKPMDPRRAFEGMLYVLKIGCPWKAIPVEVFGSSSSIYSYYLDWLSRGFFTSLWREGLAEHPEMEGMTWSWTDTKRTTDTGKGKASKQPPQRDWRPVVQRCRCFARRQSSRNIVKGKAIAAMLLEIFRPNWKASLEPGESDTRAGW